MSRVIKFRAWDKEYSKWLPNDIVELVFEKDGSITGVVGNSIVELVEWTGLTDRNGVEIYEHDVVRFAVENADMWGGGTRGEVYYEETEACFAIMHKGHSYVTIGHGYDAYPGSLEVIGNIYENGDLLK